MKKILVIMMAIMMYVTSFAQTTEHMKFKGVPMEWTLQTFTNKLKAKGFTPFGVQDGVSLLKGEFAGYKDCTVVAVADKSGMICKVTVVFPTMDKWGDLERCYSRYKSMLSEKYGDPKDCVEKFQNDYINDDNSKKYELGMDRCKYYSIFNDANAFWRLRRDGFAVQFIIVLQQELRYIIGIAKSYKKYSSLRKYNYW